MVGAATAAAVTADTASAAAITVDTPKAVDRDLAVAITLLLASAVALGAGSVLLPT
jgi:hypothetical protein